MPTTNPVPSNDPTDLLFNAQKLDQVVSGSAQYYTDRLGVNRRTVEGISAAADVVLGGLGYAPPVAYASGISMTLTTQTVEYSGEIYATKVASLPFTTSIWSTDSAKFRLIQGVAATDLAAPGGSSMIGYMPEGTDAAPTTVQAKLREAVSVRDFGAVGDGATDDTDALQQAINTGKNVDLLGLTLKISYGVLVNTEGQTISNGKIVSSDSFSSAATGQFQFKITSKRVVFQNIYFDINGLAGGSQDFSSFIANGVSNCNGALLFSGGHYSSVKNCYFTRTYVGKTAVSFFGVDQNLYTTVDKCTFEYNYGGAVFTQSAGLHVSNCVVRKSNDAGIAFNTGGAKHGSVTGCHVEDCQYGGIAVESNAHHITITGNTFYQTLFGSNDCSILITSFVAGDASCYSVSISGNTFNAYKATGTGDTVVSSIIVQGGTDINISGNTYFSGGGAHNKFVFLQPLFGELNNINISNNTITGGRIGSLYTNYASSNIDKVVFSNNLYDGGIEFFRATGIPSLPTQSTGIIFDSNIMPNTTGPDFDGPSAGNVKWTFSKNYTPTWTSFGGSSLGALTNTFNIRYSDVDGAWVSNAAPTKLAWKAGDRVKTITPSVGQPKGWVCTVAGTPGTWVSEGNL